MISTMESPSFKREIISTYILEYKRLKPKEVDQSELSIMHPERQQQLQRSKYVYTRILEKNGITTNETRKKKNHTHNFLYILTSRIKEIHNSMTTLTSLIEKTHTHSKSLR